VINTSGTWNGYMTGSLTSRSGSGYLTVRDRLVKPGEWFTQEVIADGNRLRILVNDKKVVDHLDPGKEHLKGFLGLCKQGKDVVVKFRRLEFKELPPYRPVIRPGAEPGWVKLFNGKDLSGWKPQAGSTAGWEVHDGILIGSAPESILFSQRNDYRRSNLPCPVRAGPTARLLRHDQQYGKLAHDRHACEQVGQPLRGRSGHNRQTGSVVHPGGDCQRQPSHSQGRWREGRRLDRSE
jgi:hypothetical protein